MGPLCSTNHQQMCHLIFSWCMCQHYKHDATRAADATCVADAGCAADANCAADAIYAADATCVAHGICAGDAIHAAAKMIFAAGCITSLKDALHATVCSCSDRNCPAGTSRQLELQNVVASGTSRP